MQIGPGLSVLTQIQGSWSNTCHRAGLKASEGFRQDYLNISFTHFEFVAKIYADDGCVKILTQWPAKFRFSLGGMVLLANQEKAFLLNLEKESDPANAWSLSNNNILHYKSGRLSLGRESLLGASTDRLTSLDKEQSFSRR
ncbi:MAG TPA: hypothetical protein VIZ65_03250 [Cellvibrionaceae bacterium]